MKKYYSLIYSLLFFGLLALPLANARLDFGGMQKDFFWRSDLARWMNTFRLMMGDKVYNIAIAGKDHWLFFVPDVDNYQRLSVLGNKRLADLQTNLDAFGDRLARRGIKLVLVLVPSKATIYPEYMPGQIPTGKNDFRFDQVADYLARNSKVTVVNTAPALRAAHQERTLYYARDTHWNSYGMYLGYVETMNALHDDFPSLSPLPLSDFSVVSDGFATMNLARAFRADLKEEVFTLQPKFQTKVKFRQLQTGDDDKPELQVSWQTDSSLPRAVIYHDSFFFEMIPLLEEHFSRAVFIRHFAPDIWDLRWIDQEKPDVVIIEFSEQNLSALGDFLKK